MDVRADNEGFLRVAYDDRAWLHGAFCRVGTGEQDDLVHLPAKREFDPVQDPAGGSAGYQESARAESVPT